MNGVADRSYSYISSFASTPMGRELHPTTRERVFSLPFVLTGCAVRIANAYYLTSSHDSSVSWCCNLLSSLIGLPFPSLWFPSVTVHRWVDCLLLFEPDQATSSRQDTNKGAGPRCPSFRHFTFPHQIISPPNPPKPPPPPNPPPPNPLPPRPLPPGLFPPNLGAPPGPTGSHLAPGGA